MPPAKEKQKMHAARSHASGGGRSLRDGARDLAEADTAAGGADAGRESRDLTPRQREALELRMHIAHLVVARYDEAKWFAMGPGDGHTFDDDGTGDGGALPLQDDEGKGAAGEPVSVGLFDQASAPALASELLV